METNINVIRTIENDKTLLDISGRIDTVTSPLFHDEIAATDTPDICLDFKDVEYISSAGLRELLICRKRFKGDAMSVINVSPEVFEIFVTTGFDQMIPVQVSGSGNMGSAEFHDRGLENLSFCDFLKAKRKEAPHKNVLKSMGRTYTWSDIDRASDLIAYDLASRGVKKGSHVAICGVNYINWVFAFYAVQKLGGIAELINHSETAAKIGKLLVLGDATHFCYGEMPEMKDEESFIKEILDTPGCKVTPENLYVIRRDIDFVKKADELKPAEFISDYKIEMDDPAVMIFTSGSTGRSKGVLLSSYNVLHAAGISRETQTLTAFDVNCLILPLFHIFGLVAGLFANAMSDTLIVFPDDIRTDTLLNIIESNKCTIFHSVPTMLIALINNKSFDPKRVETVRCTIISGASATEAQIKEFQRLMPNNHFLTAYGLSEMAPVSTSKYGDTQDHIIHTVGIPAENIDVMIQDIKTGNKCAAGEQGEILLQGRNMMTAYYKADIDDQSIDENGWLHTGDLGFMTPDGYLSLTGRIKDIILRGGENIMPAEVEAAVSESDMIKNVRVFGAPSDFFGEEVCACIILKEGVTYDESALKEDIKTRLPKFKMPSYFVKYDEFPLLGSGKIDSVKLKEDMLTRINVK